VVTRRPGSMIHPQVSFDRVSRIFFDVIPIQYCHSAVRRPPRKRAREADSSLDPC
jgi:hypothetical protein